MFNKDSKEKVGKKTITYRILQVIMGLALVAVLFLGGCVASFPDWSAQQWAIHFLWLGISGGTGFTAWICAVLLSWSGKKCE